MNEKSNENTDTKRQTLIMTRNQMNNMQPISIANGQTSMIMPETSTDPNAVATGLRQSAAY